MVEWETCGNMTLEKNGRMENRKKEKTEEQRMEKWRNFVNPTPRGGGAALISFRRSIGKAGIYTLYFFFRELENYWSKIEYISKSMD